MLRLINCEKPSIVTAMSCLAAYVVYMTLRVTRPF